MTSTFLSCGYGVGISTACARRFGREGLAVAIVGRTADKLRAGALALAGEGVNARAFPGDLGNTEVARRIVAEARSALGPIKVIHWNAYQSLAGDLTTAPESELRQMLDIAVHGFLAAVQEALPDLKSQKGAVLVTGGGLGLDDPKIDATAVEWRVMGLSVAKTAQRKLTSLLNRRLAGDGVYVGEVSVHGIVKGTTFDRGQTATLDPAAIADRFWDIYQKRDVVSVGFPA
jgi:NADP-dependent 3-hydroxy acid dehydrogenase YdfG